MLGWDILIHRRLPGESPDAPAREVLVASSSVGLGGLEWLNKLVADGRAKDLGGNGYPDRYSISAGELLKMVSGGPPRPAGPDVIGDDYFMPGNWVGKDDIDYKLLAARPSDELLEVEAWDQS